MPLEFDSYKSMRVVIQRVSKASVTVEGYVTGAINEGLAILVGIKRGDTVKEAERMVNKILGMRMWPDQTDNPWKKNVKEMEREILFVSQFTLYARMKGIVLNQASFFFRRLKRIFCKLLEVTLFCFFSEWDGHKEREKKRFLLGILATSKENIKLVVNERRCLEIDKPERNFFY